MRVLYTGLLVLSVLLFLAHVCVRPVAGHTDLEEAVPMHRETDDHHHSGSHLAACDADTGSLTRSLGLPVGDTLVLSSIATPVISFEPNDWAAPVFSGPLLFLLHASFLI